MDHAKRTRIIMVLFYFNFCIRFHNHCFESWLKTLTQDTIPKCFICGKLFDKNPLIGVEDADVKTVAEIKSLFVQREYQQALEFFKLLGCERPWTDEELLEAVRKCARQTQRKTKADQVVAVPQVVAGPIDDDSDHDSDHDNDFDQEDAIANLMDVD